MTNKLFVCCVLLIFAVLFNLSMTYMSAVYIAGDLGASTSIASYTVSFFGIGNALSLPLANYAWKRWGFYKALFYPTLLLTLFSLSLSFIQVYPLFLFFRCLQGITAGAPFLVIAGLMGKLATEQQKERMITLTLLSFLTAPVIAASFGGVLAYLWSWQISFWIDVLLLTLLTFSLHKELQQIPLFTEEVSLDWIGYLFYALGIGSFCLLITLGQQLDWLRSPFLTTCFFISLISIPYLFIRSSSHPHPVIPLLLYKNRAFALALLHMAILFSSYFGIVTILALWLSLDVNYTPEWIAFTLLMMIAGALLFIHFIWKQEYRGSLWILAIGICLLAFSCFYSEKFDVMVNFGRIAFARLLAGFGFVMFLPPLFAIVIKAHPIQYRSEVLFSFQLTRVLSSSLGVAIYNTLWQRRSAFYHDRLGSALTPFSSLTEMYLSENRGIATLSLALDLQSRSLALADCLYFIGWLMIVLLLLLIPLKKACALDCA